MTETGLPRLLLDVDGVLAPTGTGDLPPGFHRHTLVSSSGQSHQVWLNTEHGLWLRSIAGGFSMVWVSGWESDAPRLLEPILGLEPMRVIEFTPRPELGHPLRKLDDVIRFVGEAPLAWLDDELDDEARKWAARRAAPTLLIAPNPCIGLTQDHVESLRQFSESVTNA